MFRGKVELRTTFLQMIVFVHNNEFWAGKCTFGAKDALLDPKVDFDARGGPPGDEPMKSLGILGVLGGPWRAGIQFYVQMVSSCRKKIFSP